MTWQGQGSGWLRARYCQYHRYCLLAIRTRASASHTHWGPCWTTGPSQDGEMEPWGAQGFFGATPGGPWGSERLCSKVQVLGLYPTC